MWILKCVSWVSGLASCVSGLVFGCLDLYFGCQPSTPWSMILPVAFCYWNMTPLMFVEHVYRDINVCSSIWGPPVFFLVGNLSKWLGGNRAKPPHGDAYVPQSCTGGMFSRYQQNVTKSSEGVHPPCRRMWWSLWACLRVTTYGCMVRWGNHLN